MYKLKSLLESIYFLFRKETILMKPIEVGNNAPTFIAKDNHDQNISLSDYRGKKVLLSWHPLAWTPVCTDQMRALENNW